MSKVEWMQPVSFRFILWCSGSCCYLREDIMPTLTLLGLGPGPAELLTEQARAHLATNPVLWLRTRIHPTVAALPTLATARSFDALYESASDFATMYAMIAHEVVTYSADADLTYAVPGHPLVAEATTRAILPLARERGITVRLIAGLSFVEPVCNALQLDPFGQGLQLLDALDLMPPPAEQPTNAAARAWCELQHVGPYQPPLLPFPLVPTQPALLSQLYNRRVASEAKLSLLARYPADHPVSLVLHAGLPEEQLRVVPLHEIDHQTDLDHLTAAYLPALAPHAAVREIEGVQWVTARLLGPNGCPWDRQQTPTSLRQFLLEETYEVLEALDEGDPHSLSEELGDLLLQILMHSELARQSGTFDFSDVTTHITEKLIRRHPHVFGDLAVSDSAEVLRNWDAIKQQEHAAQGKQRKSILDGVPKGLPALATAQQLTHKAAKVDFDWPDLAGIWDKIEEELGELRAVNANDPAQRDQLQEEFGDVLFSLANLARWLDLDGETALREANAKFRRRFVRIEELAGQEDGDLTSLDLQAKDRLWEQAKYEERQHKTGSEK